VQEDVLWLKGQPRTPGPAYQLNGDDRIATQLEKVIIYPNPLCAKQFLPQLHQFGFRFGAGRLVGIGA
jgi:hypothetical protein